MKALWVCKCPKRELIEQPLCATMHPFLSTWSLDSVVFVLPRNISSFLTGLRDSWQQLHEDFVELAMDYSDDYSVPWIVDSGAQCHSVCCEMLLQNVVKIDGKYGLGFSGKKSQFTHFGDAYLPNPGKEIRLRGVWCCPLQKDFNLLSVPRLTTDYPFSVKFDPQGFIVKNLKTKKVIAEGHHDGYKGYIWPVDNDVSINNRTDDEELNASVIICALNLYLDCFNLFLDYLKDLIPWLMDLWVMFCAWLTIYADYEVSQLFRGDLADTTESWIVDSGAHQHCTNDINLLHNIRILPKPIFSSDFSGRTSATTHVGDAYLPCRGRSILLQDVALIPEAIKSLISLSKLLSDFPCCVEFRSSGFVVKSLHKSRVLAKGPMRHKDYLWSVKGHGVKEANMTNKKKRTRTKRWYT